MAQLSAHFQTRQPSAIRVASIKFAQRQDDAQAINVAIGNVSLPLYPAMQARMKTLMEPGSPFAEGVVKYTATKGSDEANAAVLRVLESSGLSTEGLYTQITDGGSQAMELITLGVCGPAGSEERPLLLIDAAYTNYRAFSSRLGRATVSITRHLDASGHFSLPALDEIEALIEETRPGALVVIPYDNPTGHFYDQALLEDLARLCVKHDLWMVSDEAYRELVFGDVEISSVWRITEAEVPGITGRRISIETASKVWNGCGLRIGALVTDNAELHARAVAENTASLCPNAIGQHLFGALAHEPVEVLQAWYAEQRDYYRGMLQGFAAELRAALPKAIISEPEASIYLVVDVTEMVDERFDAMEFVLYCASEGSVETERGAETVLTAPMAGFYAEAEAHRGRAQFRVAFVAPPEEMARVPALFSTLLEKYLTRG